MESSNQANRHTQTDPRSTTGPHVQKEASGAGSADGMGGAVASGRLIDAVFDYLRSRQGSSMDKVGEMKREEMVRAVFRQLWRNPIPTALLGVSVGWLLFVGSRDEEVTSTLGPNRVRRKAVVTDEEEEGFAGRLEEEVVGQVEGGYDYTRRRLQELVNQYPWATAAAVVGGGLLASALLPGRQSYVPPDASSEEEEPLPKSPPPVSPDFPPEEL